MFRYAAAELCGVEIDKVVFQTVKNSDLRESVLEVNGEPVLNIAIVNGFRNIQNLVQKLKRKKCGYHYVSVTVPCSHLYVLIFFIFSLFISNF